MSLWSGLKATFIGKNNYILAKVGDKELRFHKMSLRLIRRLPRVGEPLLNALFDLYTMHSGETTVKRTNYSRPPADPGSTGTPDAEVTGHEEISSPPELEFANAREAKRKAAIKTLMEGLSSTEVWTYFGEVLMDCLFDVFPPGDRENPPPLEVVEVLGVEEAIDCLKGIYEANKVVLAPLVKKIQGRLGGSDEGLREALEEILQSRQPLPQPSPPTLEPAGAPSS